MSRPIISPTLREITVETAPGFCRTHADLILPGQPLAGPSGRDQVLQERFHTFHANSANRHRQKLQAHWSATSSSSPKCLRETPRSCLLRPRAGLHAPAPECVDTPPVGRDPEMLLAVVSLLLALILRVAFPVNEWATGVEVVLTLAAGILVYRGRYCDH